MLSLKPRLGSINAACNDKAPFSSFTSVYEENKASVCLVFEKFGFTPQERADLAQETFLRFFLKQERINPDKVRAYLARTARNLAIDAYRKNLAQKLVVIEDTSESIDCLAAECDFMRDRILRDIAAEFLEELKLDPNAETLVMFYADEMSVKEIAKLRREAIGTVTSKLSRQRSKYKDALLKRFETSLSLEILT